MWRSSLLALALVTAGAVQAAQDVRREALLHLLRQDCGSCHGMTLRGGLGAPLTPEALAGKPDEFLVRTILEGRAGTAMPPWAGRISETEARWLVRRLKEGLGPREGLR